MSALQPIVDELVWFFTDDDVSRSIALLMWTVLFGMLCIPTWRRLFGTPKVTDDLLTAAWFLMMNRVSFSIQALLHNDAFGDFVRWFSICAGLFYGYVVWPYARRNRR